MAALNFRADLKLATKTLAAIDAATLRQADDGLRPHLGASPHRALVRAAALAHLPVGQGAAA